MPEERTDKGWEYLQNNDKGICTFYEDDGSWGYQIADGSGSYYGADGSCGTKNADGSAEFYGAKGNCGIRTTDGRIYYIGENGAWGYKNSNGSGAYYSSPGLDNIFYEADNDEDEEEPSALDLDGLSNILAVAIDVVNMKISQKREQEHEEEAAQRAEAERLRQEKVKERKAKNALRKQRVKAFFSTGKKIEIRYGHEELIGGNIDFVIKMLTENAFTNIRTVPIKDIYTDSPYKTGQVEEVVINGTGYFKEGDQIPYDVDIMITYHEKREMIIPFSEKNLRKMNCVNVCETFRQLGFTEIYEKPIYDLVTGWVKKDGAVEKVTIGEEYPFKKNSMFAYDTKIVVEYHTFKNKQSL